MALRALVDGVWIDTVPVHPLWMNVTATMAVLRLSSDTRDLLLYSPVKLTPERRADVESLGTVAHLYAPNTYHHSWIGEWAAAFPAARVHAPPGLVKKRRDLRIDRVCDGAARERAFDDAGVDEVRIDGFALEESVLFHRASRTLVVADLVQNIGKPADRWTTLYTKLAGFHDRVALSRIIRWGAFRDRRRARVSLDAVLALPLERIVVGHGEPVVDDARAQLASAYRWLTRA